MTEWQDEDEVTITYGTLRKAMAESAEAERERIVALLELERDEADEVVDLDIDLEPQIAYHESVLLTYLIAKIKGEIDE